MSRPKRPASTACFISFDESWNRDGKIVPSLTPALSQASMMRSHFLSVISSGFSTMTCLPAFAAATAGSMWAPLGVAIVTASTAGVGEHRVDRVVAAAADLLGEGLGAAGRRVGAGDELGAADVGQGLGVKATDHAGADDAESDGHRDAMVVRVQ